MALYRVIGIASDIIPILPHEYDLVPEFLKITTNGITFNVGDRLMLQISYMGTLFDGPRGFFRYSYRNERNQEM